jgi:Zn-dependent M28 family amino/carboxypeptidase
MAVAVVLFALIFRMAGVFCCTVKTSLNSKERLFCMISYTPKATVQAAIGAVPLSMGLACGNLVLTAAVLAILITAPVGAAVIDSTYKKLLKYGAKAFISFSGDITDTKETSDLDNKELRDVLRKKGIIPGVHMRVNTATQLVKDNPKELTLEIEQDEFTMTSHNVLCEIEGTKYPEEVIYVTAHYDSVEFSKGAYDNGAGSVLIMKLLEYFKENKPLRTVKFLWCGSEERGLLGSKAYINNLSEESIEKIIFNINVDVAGTILGTEYASIMAEEALVNYVNYVSNEINFPIVSRQDIYSSDSIPFSDKGIPAINLMRFGPRGAAHIHDRYDTMSFISEESLKHTYTFLEYLSNKLINSNVFPVKRTIPENIKKKIDEYLFKNED